MGESITINLKEIGWSDMNRTLLIQGRVLWRAVVKKIKKLWVP
jgi:hypothetical protein